MHFFSYQFWWYRLHVLDKFFIFVARITGLKTKLKFPTNANILVILYLHNPMNFTPTSFNLTRSSLTWKEQQLYIHILRDNNDSQLKSNERTCIVSYALYFINNVLNKLSHSFEHFHLSKFPSQIAISVCRQYTITTGELF